MWVALLLLPQAVAAHTVGISRGEYELTGDVVTAYLIFAGTELAMTLPRLDANQDGGVTEVELAGAREVVDRMIVQGMRVRAGAADCQGTLSDTGITEEDGLSIRAVYRCPPGDRWSVDLAFLGTLSQGHRHLASVTAGSAVARVVAYDGNAAFEIAASRDARAASAWEVALPLFRLGVQHILSGYDHLLFLFGLILVGGRLRSLFIVVSAFTLAHSITLGLAAFDVFSPSPAFVEPAIALSIVYVGVENWFVEDAARRWLITFPFGLIHGFGFAGALKEIALPPAQIPTALVAFNLGVEAGQIAVLIVVLPVVLWLRDQRWFAVRGLKLVSTGIALAGAFWFVTRIA
jgi:hydrogenase/urease accessory protein HupE